MSVVYYISDVHVHLLSQWILKLWNYSKFILLESLEIAEIRPYAQDEIFIHLRIIRL